MSDNSPRSRCRYLSVAQAMKTAADGDIIVVSGVITENITLNKDVTLRGPMPDWSTPGTHMGFVQGATAKPGSACTGDTVVNVPAGSTVTIEDLNIRYGCATNGGGINNAGTLHLKRSTVYDNRASADGGGVYNSGTLDVTDSTLAGNASANGGGIANASGATLTVRRLTFKDNTASSSAQSIANSGTATVGGSILATTGTTEQCSGTPVADAANLINGPGCTVDGIATITGDPLLGALARQRRLHAELCPYHA